MAAMLERRTRPENGPAVTRGRHSPSKRRRGGARTGIVQEVDISSTVMTGRQTRQGPPGRRPFKNGLINAFTTGSVAKNLHQPPSSLVPSVAN